MLYCYIACMRNENTNHQIYIGAPIEHASERKFIASIVKKLEAQKVSFVILANLQVGGRQIDCIVATEHGVSVVEVKSSHLPVRGDINGTWARLHASGEWQAYSNAHQQALAAKNVLRDAMTAIKPVGNFYPNGHVVFTSSIAEGSQLTSGDFKVKVSTLDQFLSNFSVQGTAPWTLDDWRDFATNLSLTPISGVEAAASPENQELAELLRKYNSAFASEYGRDAERWLPEKPEQRSDLLAAATTGTGCFVNGPSGCGKTLMAKWVAAELSRSGRSVFFFAAKDFAGTWADFLRREIALLTDLSPAALWQAILRSDRAVFLVLDGINELGENVPNALRGIRALARRLGAKLIVTAQGEKPAELNGLHTITVNRPSFDLKRRIARSGGIPLSAAAIEVLRAVGSSIEAEIVGKIGAEIKSGTTRLVLIDQYIRMRLGGCGRAGSFGLRRLASRLHEQVAFSLPETDFDEFMRSQGLRFDECDALFAAGLLVRRGGRISFSHEMIQNACAAFDLARQAATDPPTFGLRLSTPILEAIAGDIVSAIEDACICRAVLGAATNPSLLSAATDGELGSIAASVARTLLEEATDACVAEIRGARLMLIEENDAVRVEWAEDARRDWTTAERARLCALGHLAASGTGLDVYFGLCAEMDKHLDSERRRLAEAARKARFLLKSRSFELAYYGFSCAQIGFTHVARASQPGFRELRHGIEKREFNMADMSSGQLHFLLENRHSFFGHNGDCRDDDRFAEELIYLLRERFHWEPYHVQLATLHAVGLARRAPDETLERLVEAINALDVSPANWAISTSIVEALKRLGALDDDAEENREHIKREIASAISDDMELDDGHEWNKSDLSLSLCVRMFDHPFNSIYAEEIFELAEAQRRILYRRAIGASDIKSSFIFDWLCGQVASFEDTADVPLIRPLVSLPDPTNLFPQEEWAGFVIATRFLGRHGAELPRVECESSADRCLADIRMLVYAAESKRQLDIKGARLAWQRLHAMPAQLVIGCLSEVQKALTERQWYEVERVHETLNLDEVYSADCLTVARRFVENGKDAQYFHRVPMRELGPLFAFRTIGRYGDRSDIDHLRGLSRAHPFAQYALSALKSLDAVSSPAS